MSEPEPILLSWSGGKDCAMALAALVQDPVVRVVALLTSVTDGYDRISMHGVRRALLHRQADSLGLPLLEAVIPPTCTNERYDAVMRESLERARTAFPGLRRVAFGDLFLEDVRTYREARLALAEMEALFPLWRRDTRTLADEFVAHGFRARLVCVDTTQLDGSFAGRSFDRVLLADLPPDVDPCGERGEFHTFVSDGPIFRQPVEYTIGETVLREERFAYCDLLP